MFGPEVQGAMILRGYRSHNSTSQNFSSIGNLVLSLLRIKFRNKIKLRVFEDEGELIKQTLPLLSYQFGRRCRNLHTGLGRAHTGVGNVVFCHLHVVHRDNHAGDQLGARVRASVIHNPTPTAIFNTLDVLYHSGHPALLDVGMH